MVYVAEDLKAVVEQAFTKLRGLDVVTLSHRPRPDRWTIKEVIGHLIDSCANNHQRFIRAQFTTELAFPRYEQNQWVNAQHYDQVEWADLLELWRRYNLHLAHVISHISPAALNTRSVVGDYPPMTLQILVEDYVVHLKHHLSKIDERLRD